MFGPQQLVWSGQVPVRFDLASNEVTTYQAPRPMFVMIPRMSYFPLLLARVVEYFEKYAPPTLGIGSNDATKNRVRNVWFESNGVPLRWHLPVGVLYDVLMKAKEKDFENNSNDSNDNNNNNNNNNDIDKSILPWKIVVHFQSFPAEKIIRFEGLDSVRWNFMSDLKQAMYVRLRSAKSVLNLPKQEQEQMWEGLKLNDSLKFWKINSKLIIGNYDQKKYGNNNASANNMGVENHQSSSVASDEVGNCSNSNNNKLHRLPVRILLVTLSRNNMNNDDKIDDKANTEFDLYQRPINAYQFKDDGGTMTLDYTRPHCVGNALIECIPKYRDHTLKSIEEHYNNKTLRFIIHGIDVSPYDDLIKACNILSHADNFLYLIVVD
jgi:hypothetical protein